MFLDANMSNEVEQKLKENFPNFKKSISKKHVTILILVTMTKKHTKNIKMALSSCSFPIMPPYLTF